MTVGSQTYDTIRVPIYPGIYYAGPPVCGYPVFFRNHTLTHPGDDGVAGEKKKL
jgi:hypothetical protein